LALSISAPAQVQQAWIARHTLSTTGTNQAVALAFDKAGNIIVAGHGTSTNGDFDYVTLKYASNGSLLWEANYSGPGDDQVRAMTLDQSGKVLVTGTSVTVKYDSNSGEKWTAPYGGRGVAVDPSGDVYVTGFDETNFATVKLHREAGTNLWLRTTKVLPVGQGRDVSHVIGVDAKSNVFVSGKVVCYRDPRSTYLSRRTVSYDANGGWRWETATFPDDCFYSGVEILALLLGRPGEIIEVGQLDGQIAAVRKLSSDGALIWSAYPKSQIYSWSTLRAGCVDKNGFVYLAGKASDNAGFPIRTYFAVEKLHPSGTNMWLSTYRTGTIAKIAHAVALDDAGNVYATGQSPGISPGGDYTTIKYDPDGNEKWVQRYNGPGNGDDVATAIAVAPDGSVYVTGWSTTSSNLIEITTIKYAPIQNVQVQTNQTVLLQFLGTPGQTYRFQATTNFGYWEDLGAAIADPLGLYQLLDTNPPLPRKFYRTVTP
jgi:hypothetical protein